MCRCNELSFWMQNYISGSNLSHNSFFLLFNTTAAVVVDISEEAVEAAAEGSVAEAGDVAASLLHLHRQRLRDLEASRASRALKSPSKHRNVHIRLINASDLKWCFYVNISLLLVFVAFLFFQSWKFCVIHFGLLPGAGAD